MHRRLIIFGIAVAGLVYPAGALANVQLGVFANEPGGIPSFERALGGHVTIDHHYAPWTYRSWAFATANDASAGHIPLFSWSAAPRTTAAAIMSGSQDTVIVAAARAMAATGKPIYLRPFYEFDQPAGHKRYIGTPAQVVVAWQRVVTLFRDTGATNVKFVWCPMAFDFANGRAQQFWPGASFVDEVGADGYNFPTLKKFRTFGTIFQSAYAYAVSQSRPFFVAETASDSLKPATPAWIQSIGGWTATHPDTGAVVYFDSVSPKGYDFRLVAHAGALSAFRSLALSAAFAG
ncbi:MAG TPA: glycosyl hydrolase [Gaiellales bacterium]|nr:glycosyl hydrolase [Gaiellales bacterium]